MQARVAKLEERLEIDHCYGPDGQRKEIAPADRDTFPDGIFCRDADIQLRDDAIRTLKARCAQLEEALNEAIEGLYNPFEPNNQSRLYTKLKALTPTERPLA